MAGTKGHDITILKRIYRDELIHILESVPGNKNLILEDAVLRVLDCIAGMTVLRQHGVDKIFRMETGKDFPSSECRMFMVRPTIANSKTIANVVSSDKVCGRAVKTYVTFVPRQFRSCEFIFEQQGVYGDVTFIEFPVGLIQIDRDMLSLEMPEIFTSSFVDCINEWTYTVAHSLWRIQSLFGAIPHIYAIGSAANSILKLVDTLFWEFDERSAQPTPDMMISHLFILDRPVDFASVFLTCLSYEGLLDEHCNGIQCGAINIPNDSGKPAQETKVMLWNQNNANNDDIFEKIRNQHFSTVFQHLSNKAKQLQAGADKRNELESVSDMKRYVATELKGLKQLQKSLVLHLTLSETILSKKQTENFEEQLRFEHAIVAGIDYRDTINYIEDLMCEQVPVHIPLSLICLLSLVNNGIPTKDYESLRMQYTQAYGHKFLYSFHQLKRMGILYPRDYVLPSMLLPPTAAQSPPANRTFQAISKRFGLFPKSESIDLRNPIEMSYVFNGAYIPLCCQLVANGLQAQFSADDLQRLLGCPVTEKHHTPPVASALATKTVMVYFIGGVTYAEIAALRLLGRLRNYNILIAASHIINRKHLLDLIADD